MTQIHELLNEVKEKRLDDEALATARADVESLLFRSWWRKMIFGVALGGAVFLASCDPFELPKARGAAAWYAFVMVASLFVACGRIWRRKTKALRRLIEKEAPELHARLTNRLTD